MVTHSYPTSLVPIWYPRSWGFTRFHFKNDDGEIVSYDTIKD
jgi:hypothetical protein